MAIVESTFEPSPTNTPGKCHRTGIIIIIDPRPPIKNVTVSGNLADALTVKTDAFQELQVSKALYSRDTHTTLLTIEGDSEIDGETVTTASTLKVGQQLSIAKTIKFDPTNVPVTPVDPDAEEEESEEEEA